MTEIEFFPTVKWRYPEISLGLKSADTKFYHDALCYLADSYSNEVITTICILRQDALPIEVTDGTVLQVTEYTANILGKLQCTELQEMIGWDVELQTRQSLRKLEDKEVVRPFLKRFRSILED